MTNDKIEKLKRETNNFLNSKFIKTDDDYENAIVNSAIDHLHSRGLIVQLDEVDGLVDALQEGVFDFNNGMDFPTHLQRDAILQTARLYLELLEKQKGQSHE